MKEKISRKNLILFGVVILCLIVMLLFFRSTDTKQHASNDTMPSQQPQETEIRNEAQSETAAAVSETADELMEKKIENILADMTLEEKVAQMFIIAPEAIDGTTKEVIDKYPVGGFVYFAQNIESTEQVKSMIDQQQEYSMERIGLPLFISIDEEGGQVARIANDSTIRVEQFPNLSEIGASLNMEEVKRLGQEIGSYLFDLGFNLDYAPVADVLTNAENTVVKNRSFGSDAAIVSEMVLAELEQMEQQGIYGCLKHFPGHGATAEDSHEGFAYTDRTLEELQENEFLPFIAGIEKGVSFIMMGHISAPKVTGDNVPSSLSEIMVTDILRDRLGYEGIIITDAMNMGAISKQYDAGTAAVKAVKAGVDVILMPQEFEPAYAAVLASVAQSDISQERIDESIKRIIGKKIKLRD